MIKEIWGNGVDVIIKYEQNGITFYTASKWLKNNSNMNCNWLIKNGFRRIQL